MRRWWLIQLFVLVSCISSGGGCPRTAGGDCDPLEDEELCPTGYYCSRSGVCTKTCNKNEDCLVGCGPSDCRVGTCVDAGVCSDSVSVVCQGGYCVNPANPSDPYGPKDPSRE